MIKNITRGGLVAVAVASALALTACGSSSSVATTTTAASIYTSPPNGGGGGGFGARSFPGASGEIAAITGTTLQVQGTSGQTAVTYTPTTTFRQTVSATQAAVTVGTCISAFGTPASGSSTFGGPVTATTVSISQPVSGACTGGFGGGFRRSSASGTPGGGSFPGGGTPPRGSFPAGGFRGGRFGVASGLVKSVSGNTVTVQETNPQTSATSSVVVTLTGTTTFTESTTATATDLAVGKCARATGSASSTGAITARSIVISTPGANGCYSGFGFRGGATGAPASGAPGGNTGA